jgi:hypothetical protein
LDEVPLLVLVGFLLRDVDLLQIRQVVILSFKDYLLDDQREGHREHVEVGIVEITHVDAQEDLEDFTIEEFADFGVQVAEHLLLQVVKQFHQLIVVVFVLVDQDEIVLVELLDELGIVDLDLLLDLRHVRVLDENGVQFVVETVVLVLNLNKEAP